MKTNKISVMGLMLITAVLFLQTPVSAKTFADVPPNHWAFEAIDVLSSNGVLNGVGDNKFSPDTSLSYAQWISMIYSALWHGEKSNYDGTFNHWVAPMVENLEYAGILIPKGKYNQNLMDKPIPRSEMAFILSMAYSWKGGDNVQFTNQFSDISSLSDDDQYAINKMAKLGFVSGKGQGKFYPNDSLKRSEGALVLFRFLDEPEKDLALEREFDNRAALQQGLENIQTTARPTLDFNNTITKFSDIDIYAAENANIPIMRLSGMHGYVDGSYRPDEYITYAEFLLALARITYSRNDEGNYDPQFDHWAGRLMTKHESTGLVIPNLYTYELMDKPIPRYVIANQLSLYEGWKYSTLQFGRFGKDRAIGGKIAAYNVPDISDLPESTQDNIRKVLYLQLMVNKEGENFRPHDYMTRKEAVELFHYLNYSWLTVLENL